jgi:antitoxin component YwqK of YwqJK toxin-antitoxin module
MRHLVVMLAGVMTVSSAPSEHVTVRRTFHANGVPSREGEYRNGVRHGVYRTWYADGRPYEVRHYVDGREQGLQRSWTPDGVLYLNYEMKNGRRYGLVNAAPCLPAQNENAR